MESEIHGPDNLTTIVSMVQGLGFRRPSMGFIGMIEGFI